MPPSDFVIPASRWLAAPVDGLVHCTAMPIGSTSNFEDQDPSDGTGVDGDPEGAEPTPGAAGIAYHRWRSVCGYQFDRDPLSIEASSLVLGGAYLHGQEEERRCGRERERENWMHNEREVLEGMSSSNGAAASMPESVSRAASGGLGPPYNANVWGPSRLTRGQMLVPEAAAGSGEPF